MPTMFFSAWFLMSIHTKQGFNLILKHRLSFVYSIRRHSCLYFGIVIHYLFLGSLDVQVHAIMSIMELHFFTLA
jgi:hypothetical protein